jgi:FkbM family methyltransferase
MNTCTARINVADKPPVDFTLWDTATCRVVTQDIVLGKTYPLIPLVEPVRIVVDVGANIGAATFFFHANHPEAIVYAYEPIPESFDLLSRNLAGLDRIVASRAGLWNCECVKRMYRGTIDPCMDTIRGDAQWIDPDRYVDVPMIPAREAIEGCDILKIDTEGCEVVILQNAFAVLENIRLIYLETRHPADQRCCDDILRPTHTLYSGI